MGNSPKDMLRDLSEIQRSVNRLAEDLRIHGGTWCPAADVYETATGMTIELEVPEVRPEELEVTLRGSELTIRGERAFARNREQECYHRVERCYGSFSRSFTLPAEPNPSDLDVSCSQGVLIIRLACSGEETRKIPVR